MEIGNTVGGMKMGECEWGMEMGNEDGECGLGMKKWRMGEWKWGNGGIRMKMGSRDRASRWQNGNREMEMEEWGCENI